MTYRGLIKNGVAVLDTPGALPDGTPVRVEVERPDADFWQRQSIEQLAARQHVQPITNLADLAIDWPKQDSVEDFLAFIRCL